MTLEGAEMKGRITLYEVWIVPGEAQTLDQMIAKFGQDVIEVDTVNNRLLIRRESY